MLRSLTFYFLGTYFQFELMSETWVGSLSNNFIQALFQSSTNTHIYTHSYTRMYTIHLLYLYFFLLNLFFHIRNILLCLCVSVFHIQGIAFKWCVSYTAAHSLLWMALPSEKTSASQCFLFLRWCKALWNIFYCLENFCTTLFVMNSYWLPLVCHKRMKSDSLNKERVEKKYNKIVV